MFWKEIILGELVNDIIVPNLKIMILQMKGLKAYILMENAKMIYSNSFNPTDEEPSEGLFQEMVDLAITNLTKYRNFTHYKKQINT